MMRKQWKILGICLLSLVLAVVVAVPAVAAQGDGCIYQWVYHENPLYSGTLASNQLLWSDGQSVEEESVCWETLEEAAAELREKMKVREETITVTFIASSYDKQLANDLFSLALEHTGDPTEGDYLRWHYQGWGAGIRAWHHGENQYRNEITYTMRYLTDAEQEKAMDAAVEDLLEQLDVYSAGQYKKVSAIYDYLCENVVYDYDGANEGDAQAHTAYAALINGKSVCQGYASLFYRLALRLGVDTRVISGIGNGGAHGWNIVKLGNSYYDLDATWDAIRKQNNVDYEYFLRCDANFEDHIRDEAYLTPEFQQTYVMAQQDYTPGEEIFLSGDLDNDGTINENDVIYLLWHSMFPQDFPVAQKVDYTGDSQTNEDDVIYLLQHTMFPEIFPIEQ